MKSICFYFQVHQPFRLRTYRFFDIGTHHHYFDDYRNRYILQRVAEKCYLPMNQLLLDLIHQYGEAFKVSFSISGVALEQFRQYAPAVLESFQRLAATGCVEFLAETYSHSLSSLKSKDEFVAQVSLQRKMVKELLGQEPTTFRNTELIYSDGIGEMVAEMGFDTMLTEGARHILGWKSPNYLYCNAINPKLKILLKNFRLSDDVAFRFSQHTWDGFPLTTEKYVDWLNSDEMSTGTINLFMDYETFGEHQWPETGIFDFMRALPGRVFSHSGFRFMTPAEVSRNLQPVAAVEVPYPISWADEERDLTAWLGNDLQDDAFHKLYEIEQAVKNSGDEQIIRDWRFLQTSDHFYYMCTKWFSDGDVHKYFNPYNSPYEAYVNFMNILSDFLIRTDTTHVGLPTARPAVRAEAVTEAVRKTVKKTTVKRVAKAKSTEKKGRATVKSSVKKADTGEKDDLKLLLKFSKTHIHQSLKGINAFTLGIALTDCDAAVREHVLAALGVRIRGRLEAMKLPEEDLTPKMIALSRKKVVQAVKKTTGK